MLRLGEIYRLLDKEAEVVGAKNDTFISLHESHHQGAAISGIRRSAACLLITKSRWY